MRTCCGPPALKGSFANPPPFSAVRGSFTKQGLQGRRAALRADHGVEVGPGTTSASCPGRYRKPGTA